MAGSDNKRNLVVVSSDVLPEIISKVLDAKRMLARGDARNSSDACRAVGISRSAYYKYKDSVFTYEERLTNKIISLYLTLCDEKGVLSAVLSKLYEHSVNILTVNQNIPVDGVATVTISFIFEENGISTPLLQEELRALAGVVSVKIISGE